MGCELLRWFLMACGVSGMVSGGITFFHSKRDNELGIGSLSSFLGSVASYLSLPGLNDEFNPNNITIENLNEAKAYIQSLSKEEYRELKEDLECFIFQTENGEDDSILSDGMDIVNDFRGNDTVSDEAFREKETDVIISNIERLDDERGPIFEKMEDFSSRHK